MLYFWGFLPIIYIIATSVKERMRLVAIILCVVLIFLQGMRDWNTMIGDTMNYYLFFSYGESAIKEQFGPELLYTYLNIFCIRNSLSFQWVLLTMAAVSLVSIYKASDNMGIKPIVGIMTWVLLSYYFNTYNVMRQMIAESILVLGYSYLYNRNLSKFICCVIIASMFHISSLIALCLIVFHYKSIRIPEPVFAGALILTLVLGVTPVAWKLMSFISSLSFGQYSLENIDSFNQSISISKIAMVIFYIYLYHYIRKDDILIKIVFLGMLIFNFVAFHVDVMRLGYVFLAAQTILLPKLTLKDQYYSKKNHFQFIAMCYMVFIYYYMMSWGMGDVIHYKMSPIEQLFT